jgi:hypothetical protein
MAFRRHLFDVSPPRRSKKDKTADALEDQILAAGLPVPELEYPFAAVIGRDWRFDYAWPRPYLFAVEVEGALFGGRVINVRSGFEYRTVKHQKVHVEIDPGTIFRLGGGHNTGERLKRDLEKRAYAAILGYAVLPVMPEQVTDLTAIELIRQALRQRGWKGAQR